MSDVEKIKLLEEMLDLEDADFARETELSDIEEWDSMAAISLIALMDEKFGKRITGNEIRAFKTIGDVIDSM